MLHNVHMHNAHVQCTGQIRIISVAVEDRGSVTSAVVHERGHDQPEEFSGELFSCSGPVHCLLLLGKCCCSKHCCHREDERPYKVSWGVALAAER